MKKAEERAKESTIKLCMADDLKQKKHWELPPLPTYLVADDDDSSDEDDNDNEVQKVETKAEEVKVARKKDVKKVVDKKIKKHVKKEVKKNKETVEHKEV